MPTRARIATLCQNGEYFPTVEENRAEMLRRLKIALKQAPDLVCLPEAFSTVSVSCNLNTLAETLDGSTITEVSALARLNHCYILCPLITRREGKYWNSVVILDRSGGIVGIYDKIHPVTSAYDYTSMEYGITPGSENPVFELDFGRIGIQICFDILYPETWAELSAKGAKAVFWVSAYNGGFPLQAYAWMHHYYVVTSVQTHKACMIDPCGTVLAETDRHLNLIVRDINLDYAVCHYDFNYSIPDRILSRYPGQVDIRSDGDTEHFVIEPINPEITIAQLKDEFGIITVQEYAQFHQNVYPGLRGGYIVPSQDAGHGNRPMYNKEILWNS